MKLSIVNKAKKDTFISLFQLLKSCASIVNIIFNEDHLYIQGMDKSHVCLFDIKIFSSWFSSYEFDESDSNKISIDTNIFHNVLSINQEYHTIYIHYEGDADSVHIDLINETPETKKGDFDKFFKLPLADLDAELLGIPNVDYDAEFSIPAKKICEIASQLLLFGDTINVKCSEEKIDLASSGTNGEMTVNIPIDDLSEFSISEGESLDLHYSLNYIQKMCLTTRLSSEIEFGVSGEFPMRIKYDLGDNSQVVFFIAPKIAD
jgi:proliferating cell nuclear antigen PCNA|uniref:Proliferating cell nuclear antigen PCNA N-terminal domain-containing protein n=1 Tax=viral metagenome TaxID=1070528 RepID=A0A6C0HC51_9ZZZZ